MKSIFFYLCGKLRLYIVLLFLLPELYKMYCAGKRYKKKYPNGTIQFLEEYSNFDLFSLDDKNVLLFLVYNPKSILMYERYFELLKKLNYKIVVISNGEIERAFLNKFQKDCTLIAKRHNIGRDFGAYKEFFCLLFHEKITPKNVIICNDSVFANLRRDDSRFLDFMKSNEVSDFVGVAEFFGEPNYHLQSYFLKFSKNVLQGNNFKKFWQNFFVSDNRRRNIHKGEVMLSQSILKDGYSPKVFLGTDNVIAKIVENEDYLFRFIVEFSANYHLYNSRINFSELFRKFYIKLHADGISDSEKSVNREQLKIEISRLINKSGMISIVPFLIVDAFGFPFLKRDLVYHEIIDWMLIRQHANGFDEDLLNEYIEDQRLKKRPWHLKNLKEKLMYHAGII